MSDIYEIMAKALTNARASQRQSHLAFRMLEIKGLAPALNYIHELGKHNEARTNDSDDLDDLNEWQLFDDD